MIDRLFKQYLQHLMNLWKNIKVLFNKLMNNE
jgi:hypothetical protein